ncbi:MAG: VanZ family protein [Gammaproteobacteria bacterium]|nr:VanZ family protein [Gammaproteobacteria bacterium]
MDETIPQLKLLLFWRLIGWGMVITVIAISLDPSPPDLSNIQFGDKLVHFSAYFGMMYWLAQCYLKRHRRWLFLMIVALGIAIEFVQGLSGYRTFEVADMIANTSGAVVGWFLAGTVLGKSLIYLEKYFSKT